MSEQQFVPAVTGRPEKARLVMRRGAIGMPGALRVGQVRQPGVAKGDLLLVVEWLDPGIAPVSLPSPRPQQKGQWLDRGIEARRHGQILHQSLSAMNAPRPAYAAPSPSS